VASMAVEETSGGVESARWGLREFWDEKRNDTGWATIYRFKTISSGAGLKPLLMKVLSAVVQD
jgi:hypothetical protein